MIYAEEVYSATFDRDAEGVLLHLDDRLEAAEKAILRLEERLALHEHE